MTKRKFNVGDKVRVVREDYPQVFKWCWDNGRTLEKDQVLTVVSVGSLIQTEPCVGRWYPERFDLVKEKSQRDYVADHMRRTLRREAGFSKEEAAKFTANTPAELRSTYSRTLPGGCTFMQPARSFSWVKSPEGFDYWNEVNIRAHEFHNKAAA